MCIVNIVKIVIINIKIVNDKKDLKIILNLLNHNNFIFYVIKLKFGSIWALYSFVTLMNWVQVPARVKGVQFNLIFFVIFLFI